MTDDGAVTGLVGRCRLVGLGVGLTLTAGLLTACGGGDSFDAYCEVVKDQQQPLSAAVAQGKSTGLLAALPSFEALQAKAPSDVTDDWAAIVGAVQKLQTALTDAGVDPATYRPGDPPSGLTSVQRGQIETAAAGLLDPRVQLALDDVQQEALDVCQTPLTL